MLTFQYSKAVDSYLVWGSGHTAETDPTRQGWRCKLAYESGPLLVGQRGREVCATLRSLGCGKWDVAIYWDTPEEVVAQRCRIDASFHEVDDVPGWGLSVIRLIERERLALWSLRQERQ
jgi:hypothetical protein